MQGRTTVTPRHCSSFPILHPALRFQRFGLGALSDGDFGRNRSPSLLPGKQKRCPHTLRFARKHKRKKPMRPIVNVSFFFCATFLLARRGARAKTTKNVPECPQPCGPVPVNGSALGDFQDQYHRVLTTAAHLTMLAIEILRLHLPAKRKDTRQLFGIANEALPKLSG